MRTASPWLKIDYGLSCAKSSTWKRTLQNLEVRAAKLELQKRHCLPQRGTPRKNENDRSISEGFFEVATGASYTGLQQWKHMRNLSLHCRKLLIETCVLNGHFFEFRKRLQASGLQNDIADATHTKWQMEGQPEGKPHQDKSNTSLRLVLLEST